jgi:hypothetical protein
MPVVWCLPSFSSHLLVIALDTRPFLVSIRVIVTRKQTIRDARLDVTIESAGYDHHPNLEATVKSPNLLGFVLYLPASFRSKFSSHFI